MTDATLSALAEAAGVAPRWTDVHGETHDVSPDTLRAVLLASGLPAGTDHEVAESHARLDTSSVLHPLMTAQVGVPTRLPVTPGRFRLASDEGRVTEGALGEDGHLPALERPGYYRLEVGSAEITLAVAPPHCFRVEDAAPGQRPWGLTVQLYSLRREGDAGLGDFQGLADFVRSAGAAGAACVAISPVHAQFSADRTRFSPYSPSSRLMLNVLHAAPALPHNAETAALEAAPLVNWPDAAALRLRAMGEAFDRMDEPTRAAFGAFRADRGDTLETHARFEALHAHMFGADGECWHWRTWPEQFRDPRSPAVEEFAREHADEVSCHAFMQFLADRDLAAAQRAARDAGMPIGLIADLAVGADSGGSHCWTRQAETLPSLTIGAPPDLLNSDGQNWGLTAFSPHGLRQNGFGAFLEMLRAAMRHGGGVRIDHAMGLTRLWVVPEGASAKEGAYIRYPVVDLLRLIALESLRHRCIVLGEDLGTVPEGFDKHLVDASILGMRVLWFEHTAKRYTAPARWTRTAAAMTSTHDLPTVAGWWTGHDLQTRAAVQPAMDLPAEQWVRGEERTALWDAFRRDGAASGNQPPTDQPGPAVDAAIGFVGSAACELALVPQEDVVGTTEQPNLPGTLDQRPNWRRRFPEAASAVLASPAAAARLRDLQKARS